MKYLLLPILIPLLINYGYAQATYTNPVYKADFADPTVVRGHDGWFYAYGTNTSVSGTFYNIQVAKSPDLIHWTNRLYYKNGWPSVQTNSPGKEPLPGPFIKKNKSK